MMEKELKGRTQVARSRNYMGSNYVPRNMFAALTITKGAFTVQVPTSAFDDDGAILSEVAEHLRYFDAYDITMLEEVYGCEISIKTSVKVKKEA